MRTLNSVNLGNSSEMKTTLIQASQKCVEGSTTKYSNLTERCRRRNIHECGECFYAYQD